jgi:hypothetical protein
LPGEEPVILGCNSIRRRFDVNRDEWLTNRVAYLKSLKALYRTPAVVGAAGREARPLGGG